MPMARSLELILETQNLPVVAGVSIPVDEFGRYNLNALHKAAGSNPAKKPSQWLRNASTLELALTLHKQGVAIRDAVESVHGGTNPGTWACKPLAIAYALWCGGDQFRLSLVNALSASFDLLEALAQFEVPDDLPDMWVYAIREEATGNIKLGISKDPERRLQQLQTANSSKLVLVATRKAVNRFADERMLHLDAAGHAIRGEWFRAPAVDALNCFATI